jgi:NAD(P)-dependent dehydrogenase (short-subunit alcohol dehydrogenase family)
MELQLSGTVVLITGGSKGIGLACARAFASEGARVAIASRDAANLDTAKAALRGEGFDVYAVTADLVDPQQAHAMTSAVEAALGPIGVLVNSAGAARRTPPGELTAAHWHAAMDAKYYTTIHAIDAVLPGMLARRDGAIVNVVGVGGKVASPIHLPGGAANAALMLASVGLATAHARQGVRINAVNPGITMTGRVQEGLEAQARQSGSRPEDILQQQLDNLPQGRAGQPEEVADLVLFLASRRASHISGAVISIDGAASPVVV